MNERAEDAKLLAETWLTCWKEGRPDDIPLAEDFVHVSPFGRIEGRRNYLDTVKPLAAKTVVRIEVKRTIAAPGEAAILYDTVAPDHTRGAVDWVFVKDGEITEIHSFYDASKIAEAKDGYGD